MTLIGLLVVVVVICLIVYLLQRLPLPAPFNWIAPAIVILFLIVWLLEGLPGLGAHRLL